VHIDIVFLVTMTASLAVVILLSLLMNKRFKSSSYRLRKALEPFKQDEIRDVIIPDGIGGLLELEHLVLTEQGLLLIETYAYEGHLFGADEIDQWTQMVNGRSYQFINPLRHIRIARQALMTMAPEVPVFYRVVIKSKADFPKGKPTEISLLTDLETDLKFLNTEPKIPQKLQPAWDRIKRIARENTHSVKTGKL